MKTIKNLLSIFVIITALSFFSCENEPLDPSLLNSDPANSGGGNSGGGNTGGGNTGGGGSTASGVFKVDFDSQTFTANSTQAIVNNTTIAITGLKSNGSFFQITLLGTPAVGTYNNTNTSQLALAYSGGSGQIPYLGASNASFSAYPNYNDTAELKISSIDTANKIIKGTFKFNGGQINGSQLNIKNFTNGEFNLSYTTDVPAPTNNSFFAKLDGAAFNPTNITGLKSSGFISIIGRRGSVENIALSFADNITAGTTVNFTPFSSDARGQYIIDNNPSNIHGGTGSVTIISHNTSTKRIKGTFTFNAETLFPPISSKLITEGTFDITYL
jgi:hypothetical protein